MSIGDAAGKALTQDFSAGSDNSCGHSSDNSASIRAAVLEVLSDPDVIWQFGAAVSATLSNSVTAVGERSSSRTGMADATSAAIVQVAGASFLGDMPSTNELAALQLAVSQPEPGTTAGHIDSSATVGNYLATNFSLGQGFPSIPAKLVE